MKQIDEIYQYILGKYLKQTAEAGEYRTAEGTTAAEIEERFHIVRNNASTMLNHLAAEGRLVKLPGRPVRFITMEESLLVEEPKDKQVKHTLDVGKGKDGEMDPFTGLIGHKESLCSCIIQAKAAMIYPPNGLHTLLLGRSGVGKSLFAHTMYEYAREMHKRQNNEFPFIAFNCADYYNNPQLLYAHLFGYMKGAFTGAGESKAGLVEAADGGILFLDEVHRLPPNGQEMLFTLIDKGEFFRLGESERPRKSNVLIIAATTEDPARTLLTTFLRRISVTISLPAIDQRGVDERKELIRYLFEEESKKTGLAITVSQEVRERLLNYPCPGNIGQLKSDIRQICSKAFLQKEYGGEVLSIGPEFLPEHMIEQSKNVPVLNTDAAGAAESTEKELILVICSSGVGSGRIFLETVQKLLREYNAGVEAAVLPYQEAARRSDAYRELADRYKIIAGIGNMNPQLDLPYFDMTEVLSNRRDNAFRDYLLSLSHQQMIQGGFEQAYQLLEETTLAVNPRQAVKHIRTFLEQSCAGEKEIPRDAVVKCVTHMGYMLERLITGQYIRHDYKEQLMLEYRELIEKLREYASIFTEIYHIQVTDDELCFLADLMVKLNIIKS